MNDKVEAAVPDNTELDDNDAPAVTSESVDEAVVEGEVLDRRELRRRLIGNTPKPMSESITLYGCRVELRQPAFGDIMLAQEEKDPAKRAADMVVKYAYVPDTDEKIFEEADLADILKWPFNEDLLTLQTAIARLSGIDISEATEEILGDPLAEAS